MEIRTRTMECFLGNEDKPDLIQLFLCLLVCMLYIVSPASPELTACILSLIFMQDFLGFYQYIVFWFGLKVNYDTSTTRMFAGSWLSFSQKQSPSSKGISFFKSSFSIGT